MRDVLDRGYFAAFSIYPSTKMGNERLTDIVSEVDTQLNALWTQAAKAAKFREYTQELRTLRIGSTADDYRVLGARLEAIEFERRRLSTEIEQATAEAQDCDAQQAAAESQLAEAEDRLRGAERRAAENREAIAGFEANLREPHGSRPQPDTRPEGRLESSGRLARIDRDRDSS